MATVKSGLWDMKVLGGDVTAALNPFEWSQEFRLMLGFTDTTDFPNELSSWSDRLHPDHKQQTLDCFAKAINDTTGMSFYDVEYLLANKAGEYHWYRASGNVDRAADGTPLRIVGMLTDIHDERVASGDDQWRNNANF